jgi:hypothetical protein
MCGAERYNDVRRQPSVAGRHGGSLLIMERDRRIDTIRGLLVAIMIIDHVGGYLKMVTAQTLGYVSAAEGFVFLSGFVCAKVYGRYLDNTRLLLTKTFRRSFLIYRYHIAVALLLPLLALLIPPYQRSWMELLHPYNVAPLKTVLLDLVLLHQGDYLDILPLYAWLLLLCPLLLLLVGSVGPGPVLTMSFFFWGIGQFIDPLQFLAGSFGPQYGTGFFNLLSWQFLFALGICLGISGRWLDRFCANRAALVTVAVVCLIFFIFRHADLDINHMLLVDRSKLPIHRLLNFCFLMVLLRQILQNVPRNFFVPYIDYIGRYSLQIFSLHVLVIYLFRPVAWRVDAMFDDAGLTVLSLVIFALSTLPVYVYNRYRQASFLLFRQGLDGGLR